MTVQVGDVVRVTAKMAVDNEAVQNVYHYQNAGPGALSDSDFIDAVGGRLDGVHGGLNSNISDQLDYTTIEFYNVTQSNALGEVSWPTQTSGGQTSSNLLPTQVAGLLTFSTGLSKSLGKKFLGGLTIAAGDFDGAPNAAIQAALATFGTNLLGVLTKNGNTIKVGNYRVATATFIEWIAPIVEQIFATMRSRKIGVGD